MKILNRLLGAPEEINGANRCPTYLYRWTLLKWGKRGIYLHHFVGDDWSLDLHDHPKRFVSIGLRGQYREQTPAGFRIYRAPWLRTFPADHVHRLSMINGGECWTLVIVLKSVRQWGFWHLGKFIPWREYVEKGNPLADKMKACGGGE